MQIAVILKKSATSSAKDLEAVVAAVRKAPGVRRVDDEMARHLLLLVEIADDDNVSTILQLEGVEAVDEMGTKSVS